MEATSLKSCAVRAELTNSVDQSLQSSSIMLETTLSETPSVLINSFDTIPENSISSPSNGNSGSETINSTCDSEGGAGASVAVREVTVKLWGKKKGSPKAEVTLADPENAREVAAPTNSGTTVQDLVVRLKRQFWASSDANVVPPIAEEEPPEATEEVDRDIEAVNPSVQSSVKGVTEKNYDIFADVVKRAKEVDAALVGPYKSLDDLIRRINAVESSIDDFKKFGHRRTYAQIAMVHEYLEYAVYAVNGLDDLVRAAQRRQVDITFGLESFYFQVTRVFWGDFDISAPLVSFGGLSNLKKWTANRSAEKYAYVLRHLHSKRIKPEDVAVYIDRFNKKGFGTKLFGIINCDRGVNRITKPVAQVMMNEDDAILLATADDLRPVATVSTPSALSGVSGMVILAGRIVNNNLEILGSLNLDASQSVVKGAVSKLARDLGIPALDDDSKKKINDLRLSLQKKAA